METLERLRVISHIDNTHWQDLLQLTWWDYLLVQSGKKKLPENSLMRLSDHFSTDPLEFLKGDFDYHDLQIRYESKKWVLPEGYSFANYGRRRTTITTFEYIEKYHGWRLRYEILKHLNLSEAVLTDPFAPISMKIITDVLSYLAQRHFTSQDFFAMGMHSYVGNTETILGNYYGDLESSQQIIEHMWGDCLNFYEKNCRYRFLKLTESGAVLEVRSDPDVAAEMNTTHLGSEHICSLKAGMMASAPLYIGEAPAKVVERCCVHKGAEACVFEITFAKGVSYQAAGLSFA